MTQGRIIPTSVEFMDRLSVQTAYDYLGERPPQPNIGAMLLIEVDGNSQEQVEAEYNAIVDLCLEAGALDVYVGDTPATEKRMWRPRQNMAEAFKVICPVQSLEDIVVPLAQIPRLMPELERLSRRYDVLIPCYGHAGDGNLHATLVKRPEMPMEEWQAKLPAGPGGPVPRGRAAGRHHQRRARHRLQARALPAAGDGPGADRAPAAHQAGLRPAEHPESGQDLSVAN